MTSLNELEKLPIKAKLLLHMREKERSKGYTQFPKEEKPENVRSILLRILLKFRIW